VIHHDRLSRTVHRVVPGVSAGPVGVSVVLVYFTSGPPATFAATYTPRTTTRQENRA
jgi:hypothetical protein